MRRHHRLDRAANRAAQAAGLGLAVGLLALAPAALPAQGGGAALRGSVVDAHTTTPVPDAAVVLEPEQSGVFPGTTTSLAAASRTTSTNALGHYAFGDLAPGVYRVYVARYGYRPYSVVVEVQGASSVSVGLEAEPIALEPLRGRSRSRGPYVADAGSTPEMARLLAVDLRRHRFLTTDVREITHADVVEGVTLGEPDVFRALQRLPGVSTRSDYTAELWTRGAPWAQTRVFYDGVPLYNPLHALGMLSGISSSAVGTVWFHPGVRPTAMGGGAAGVIDLRSRRASGTGEVNFQGDVSLLTAGAAVGQRVLDGRGGWRLTGRSSYLDWLSDLARRAAGRDAAFPYGFSEVSGRVDARVGDRSSLELSFLWEGDHLTSVDEVDPLRAEWGNGLVQATWSTRLAGLNVQHTLGHSVHRGVIEVNPDGVDQATGNITGAQQVGRSGVEYVGLRGSLWPDPRSLGGPAWTLGYEVSRQTADYFGPVPLSIPRATANVALADEQSGNPLATQIRWEPSLTVGALWGETNWAPNDAWSVRAGLRLEAAGQIENAAELRTAPRVAVRYSPAPEVSLSTGYARVHQYVQSLAPSGVQLASLVSTDVWLLAGPGVPAIQSDVVTAGVEATVAEGRIAALNAFGRTATGIALPDPGPGPIRDRVVFVVGSNDAYGVEASVRQLTGPVTGSVSYSWTRSTTTAAGLTFRSAADRTHVLNATSMVRVLDPLRVGAAFTAATGVPFTRAISDPDECQLEPDCDPDALPWAGAPNAVRAPTYASLDLLADYSTEIGGLDVGIYAQLRNVLGRENAVVYTGTGSSCITVGCSIDELRNAYERGVPRLPVLGVRVQR